MKRILTIFVFLSVINSLNSQEQNIEDSLRSIINKHREDTNEVNAISHLGDKLTHFDSLSKYAQQGISLARKLNFRRGEADCLLMYSMAYLNSFNYTKGMEYALNALSIYNEIKDMPGMVKTYFPLQGSFRDLGDYRKSLDYAFSGLRIAEAYNVKGSGRFFKGNRLAPFLTAEIGQTYLLMNQLDSAFIYAEKSKNAQVLVNGAEWNFPVYLLATIQYMRGNYPEALADYRSAIPLASQNRFFQDTLQIFSGMSTLFIKLGKLDSVIHYASQVVQSTNPEREIKTLLEGVSNLAATYKIKGIKDSALKYTELSFSLKDSILSKEKEREIQNITFNERLKQQAIIAAQEKYKNKIQLYVFLVGVFILLLIAGILWKNNIQQKKAKSKIENAYKELKITQSQLIQSEKMASLGELTAGIAHEIQNPLNFVNNFSDVNKELVDELQQELKSGKIDDAIAISNDIRDNEQKINHHGKRADAIVKNMLQHSRAGSGKKEPTDINALAEEYLRLSYHGLRAKDKSFNAVTKTDFDNRVGKINIISQDMGRVILNLINNAFYAVNEKAKQNIPGYEPTVTVSSKKVNSRVELRVMDNGNGIPPEIVDKVFQPFFTTKPAGQGTGLGLSLSYDIITKGHGGELRVETKEGEYSEFIIILPV